MSCLAKSKIKTILAAGLILLGLILSGAATNLNATTMADTNFSRIIGAISPYSSLPN